MTPPLARPANPDGGAPRGQGQRAGRNVESPHVVAFRDPPLKEMAADLRRRIAVELLGAAPPTELPAFGLHFVALEIDAAGFALILGMPDPVARLRIAPPSAGGPVPLRLTVDRVAAVVCTVEPLHPSAAHVERSLQSLSLRLAATVTAPRLAAARALARELARLPLDAPMEHFRQVEPGQRTPSGIVRVGFGCNQDCGFCWQGRHWGRMPAEQVLRWIEDMAGAGIRTLTLSGGEPTLDSELPRYVEHARSLGMTWVWLQTNAIQCSKPGYAARLREAGVDAAFVSFHSGDAAVSDAVTRAPGTFLRTVSGVRALLDAGIEVTLNCVLCDETLPTLGALPDAVHALFSDHPRLRGLVLSVPTAPFDPELASRMVPDPARLRDELPRVIDRAMALGVRLHDLDGPCGPPLCAFGADPRVARLHPVPAHVDFRHYLPACDGCAVQFACFGLRPEQVERYGDSCVRPLAEVPRR